MKHTSFQATTEKMSIPGTKERIDIDVKNMYGEFETSFGGNNKDIGLFKNATDVSYIGNGKVLVTDMNNSRLCILCKGCRPWYVNQLHEIKEPVSSALTSDGHIVVTSLQSHSVYVVSLDVGIIQSFGEDMLRGPSGVAVASNGNFVITDTISASVSIHKPDGTFVKYLGDLNTFVRPRYVTVNQQDDIIISDAGDNLIKVFNNNGIFLRSFGHEELKCPYGVVCDSSNNIIVADHYNNRISVFSRNGVFLNTILEFGHGIARPQGIALTPNYELVVTMGAMKANAIKVYNLFERPKFQVKLRSDKSDYHEDTRL